jgi:S1-C subfamily serine protease
MQLVPRLAKYPVEGRKIVTAPPETWRGIEVDYTTAQRGAITYPRLENGWVIVTKVDSESPAFQAGVTEGMRVTHVGGAAVQTPKEFFAAVAGRADAVDLTVWSAPDSRSVKHVPPAAE